MVAWDALSSAVGVEQGGTCSPGERGGALPIIRVRPPGYVGTVDPFRVLALRRFLGERRDQILAALACALGTSRDDVLRRLGLTRGAELVIPVPFARCALVLGSPVAVARDADRERAGKDVTRGLDEATGAADRLVAG